MVGCKSKKKTGKNYCMKLEVFRNVCLPEGVGYITETANFSFPFGKELGKTGRNALQEAKAFFRESFPNNRSYSKILVWKMVDKNRLTMEYYNNNRKVFVEKWDGSKPAAFNRQELLEEFVRLQGENDYLRKCSFCDFDIGLDHDHCCQKCFDNSCL